MKILVVDDEKVLVKGIKFNLESEGYQVRWAASRRSITYTTPQGMKCRDDRLHEEKSERRRWSMIPNPAAYSTTVRWTC